MLHFVSDTHFFHYKEFLNRPILGPEMDELLIDNWNRVVKPGDSVWHIGDFGYKLKEDTDPDKLGSLKKLYGRLNGDKHIILGNHDPNNKVDKLPWASVHDVKMVSWEDNHFFLSHYSHRVWPSKHYGVYHLYGHSHGNLPGEGRSMDVGVDACQYKDKYYPISAEAVIEQLSLIEFGFKDHHDKEE